MKNKVNKYIMLVVGLFLSALSYNLFFKPSNIVVGGVSGLAIIFERLFSIDTSIFILVVNIFLIIISFIFLGFKESIRGIIGSLLFPIFVILTDNVTSYINISNVDILMLTIFGAILFGISSGIIFKAGYNSGGTDILSKIYSKYFKTSIGSANLIVNVLIIISSGFIFGINNMLYAIISLYIMSLLNDKILLGINNNKTILIVTNKPKDIRKFIINKLERGVTILYGYGGFTNDKNEVILVVIPNTEYFLLKENILNIDNKAFFVVLNSYQANY